MKQLNIDLHAKKLRYLYRPAAHTRRAIYGDWSAFVSVLDYRICQQGMLPDTERDLRVHGPASVRRPVSEPYIPYGNKHSTVKKKWVLK